MIKQFSILLLLTSFFSIVNSIKSSAKMNIKNENVTYTIDGKTFHSVVSFDDNKKGKRPAILVLPEWWGCNDYAKKRASMLAELGYIAIAVDMYGEGKMAENPKEAQELATPFYQNPELAIGRMQAALEKLKSYEETDLNNIAAIGYCFGGSMVLNAAKLGMDLKGVVSFHGGLAGVEAKSNTIKANVLVCHGGADKFVSDEDVKKFKANLDAVNANYIFKTYDGATHAFSNPDATANGKKFNMPIAYNEAADKASWDEMKKFLTSIFK